MEVFESPNVQDHAVGVLVEGVGEGDRQRGTFPVLGVPEKFATGALPETVNVTCPWCWCCCRREIGGRQSDGVGAGRQCRSGWGSAR